MVSTLRTYIPSSSDMQANDTAVASLLVSADRKLFLLVAQDRASFSPYS